MKMFVCKFTLRFNPAHIPDEDYQGIMRLGGKKRLERTALLSCKEGGGV